MRGLPPLPRFLIPSAIGIVLFLLPVSVGGRSTILLGVITDMVNLPLQPYALEVISGVIWLSALGGICGHLWGADWENRRAGPPSTPLRRSFQPAWLE